jgi:membrane protein
MQPRLLFRVLVRAVGSSFNWQHLTVAKAVAFSAALSLFPGLIFVAALLFGGNALDMLRELSQAMGHVLPPGAHSLLAGYLTIQPERSTEILVAAGLTAIWFAGDMLSSLLTAFRTSYGGVDPRPAWKRLILAVGLVFLAFVPVAAATGLMVFSRQIERLLVNEFGRQWWIVTLSGVVGRAVVLLGIVLILAMVYRVGSGRRLGWRQLWAGASLAAVLWVASTELFAFYVQYVARFTDFYGNLATAAVLLVWLYVVSVIVIIGCEFNAELERQQAL